MIGNEAIRVSNEGKIPFDPHIIKYEENNSMKALIDKITDEVTAAFKENGYDGKYGRVTVFRKKSEISRTVPLPFL